MFLKKEKIYLKIFPKISVHTQLYQFLLKLVLYWIVILFIYSLD